MNNIFNKGAYGELYVASELTKIGFHVSVPFEYLCPYDMIIESTLKTHENRFIKLQIKTTESEDGKTFKGDLRRISGQKTLGYDAGDVDVFLIVDVRTNGIMVLPFQSGMTRTTFFYESGAADHILNKDTTLRCAEFYNKNWDLLYKNWEESEKMSKQFCYSRILSFAERCDLENIFTRNQFSDVFGVSYKTAKNFLDDDLSLCYDVLSGNEALYNKKGLIQCLQNKIKNSLSL